MGCTLLAVGGMPDHIHLIVCAPGKFSPSDLARSFKGPTSALMNDIRPQFSDLFRWQEVMVALPSANLTFLVPLITLKIKSNGIPVEQAFGLFGKKPMKNLLPKRHPPTLCN